MVGSQAESDEGSPSLVELLDTLVLLDCSEVVGRHRFLCVSVRHSQDDDF